MKTLIKRLKVNPTIWLLTISDITTWGIFSTINGFIGIYLGNKFNTNIVEVIGIGLALSTFIRSILQIPIGLILDKFKTDNDEIIMLIVGNLLMGIPYLILPFITKVYMYYDIQIIFGIGGAMNLIAWRKLFSMHLDKNREGIEYGVYGTTYGIFTSIVGIAAGVLANTSEFNFSLVMFTLGIIMSNSWIIGAIIYYERRRSNEVT